MASKRLILYNVGFITIGTELRNVFVGDADGQAFFAMRSGDEYQYIPRDFMVSMVQVNKAAIDSRATQYDIDNVALPTYTEAGTGGYRKIAVTNGNDSTAQLYTGAPYFSLRGTLIDAYDDTTTSAGMQYALAAQTAGGALLATTAPSVTGIAIIDTIIDFVSKNFILVAVGVVAFVYFDPLDLFKKKKKKR